jgi:hypothetical protein
MNVSDSWGVTFGMFGSALTISTRHARHTWNTTVNTEASGDRGICVVCVNMLGIRQVRD